MNNGGQASFEVLVVGGGPAGIAASVRAAECGRKVGIVDENGALGGQIWRARSDETQPREFEIWQEKLDRIQVQRLDRLRVFDQPEPGVLLAETPRGVCELLYRQLVLATGARERFLPFPGWTLPNVMGAGGLQAMVKNGLPIGGKRVVVAGTGPLLLAVAAYLRKCGADVVKICEQASWSQLARFFVTLFAQSGKIQQAFELRANLAGIPFLANSWPMEAHGREALESVTISVSGKSETIACDYLACGFHLVPNTELAQLLGCRIDADCVQVGEFQTTTVAGVFCAGEATGIGGVDAALVQGQIAGYAAAGNHIEARKLFKQRDSARRFGRHLNRAFQLRPELTGLCSPETIVCRCEDVDYGQLTKHASWRAAKLQTRCGMGPCQGRICGPATDFLFGWKLDSVRPPVFPVRVESIGHAVLAEANADTGDHL